MIGWFETAQDAGNHPAGRYYQDEQTYLLAVGLVPLGDTVYYFDASGRLHMQAGYVTVDGQQFYITEDGVYSPPPVITDVTVSYNSKTGENTVKVAATFGAAGAAEKAYSFDGGKTWQSAASYTFKVTKDTTLAKDSVQVRDAAQPAQVEKYGYALALKGPVTGPLKGIDVSFAPGHHRLAGRGRLRRAVRHCARHVLEQRGGRLCHGLQIRRKCEGRPRRPA